MLVLLARRYKAGSRQRLEWAKANETTKTANTFDHVLSCLFHLLPLGLMGVTVQL